MGEGNSVDVQSKDTRISRLNHMCGGVTPLHLGAASGDVSAVEMLLNARADPSVSDNNGWAAADHAQGKPDVLQLLGTRPRSTLNRMEYDKATRHRNEARAAALSPSIFLELLEETNAGKPESLRELLRSSDTKK